MDKRHYKKILIIPFVVFLGFACSYSKNIVDLEKEIKTLTTHNTELKSIVESYRKHIDSSYKQYVSDIYQLTEEINAQKKLKSIDAKTGDEQTLDQMIEISELNLDESTKQVKAAQDFIRKSQTDITQLTKEKEDLKNHHLSDLEKLKRDSEKKIKELQDKWTQDCIEYDKKTRKLAHYEIKIADSVDLLKEINEKYVNTTQEYQKKYEAIEAQIQTIKSNLKKKYHTLFREIDNMFKSVNSK